ncbi:MAG TPA: isoprenylcysteine carboxylmethyltransferase family protein [Blastocatellia bacterium]|nr:isoprenylcysteine carboxylmethyltransferase family protein [Blastocatellia bacterium]
MDKQEEGRQAHTESPAICLKLPGLSIALTGPWAVITLVTLLVLVLAVVYLVIAKTEPKLWVSGGLWILFIAYWSAAAKNAAPTRSSESPASRQLHQLLMYGSLLLAFLPAPGLGRQWLPMASRIRVPIGLAVQVGSALLAVWARRHLGRNWSGAITAKVDHQLIRTGPYRFVRHPIYSAMLGMFLGTAVVSGELHGLLALVIIAVAYWRKIRIEEQHLRNVFGAEYDDYRKRSWALIPGLL